MDAIGSGDGIGCDVIFSCDGVERLSGSDLVDDGVALCPCGETGHEAEHCGEQDAARDAGCVISSEHI